MPLSPDLKLALRLADTADEISMARWESADLRVETKPDRTFVTDADRAVESAIRALVETERPTDGFFGEETGVSGDSTRQWIIDPIDGTSNYLRGVPIWGTLIALAVDGEPVLGVVSAPALGMRWWAERGSGAWKSERGATPVQMRVSGVDSLDHASMSFQSIAQWRDAGRLSQLMALSERVWRDRGYGDVWPYMLLADGRVDIVAEFDVKPYDIAALFPIVEEAGGRITSADGAPGPWHGSVLASNGVLHDTVLSLIAM
ncbi:MAG TPA: inositol monophosphatase family protein [Microbacteriaceae bacterium]|nr:inositol monophosphatase family protein [Microbacteriaceae bacterium]